MYFITNREPHGSFITPAVDRPYAFDLEKNAAVQFRLLLQARWCRRLH